MKKVDIYDRQIRNLVRNEISSLQKLKNCTSIIKLIDIFEDKEKIYLINEFCEEEISLGNYSDQEIINIAY